jgi:hypothetical protein
VNFTHINERDDLTRDPDRWREFPLSDGWTEMARAWDEFEDALARPYRVGCWNSHPDAGNDDCMMGAFFSDLDEAIASFEAESAGGAAWGAAGWVEIRHRVSGVRIALSDGADVIDDDDDDDAWRRERAMEIGMLHGVDAYNEAMGWATH